MDTLSYKTVSINKQNANKEWVVVDATDQVLGRLCTRVAKLLRGKYKPTFTPNADCGDNVIIINADKVRLTGKKWTDRIYLTYSLSRRTTRTYSRKHLQKAQRSRKTCSQSSTRHAPQESSWTPALKKSLCLRGW